MVFKIGSGFPVDRFFMLSLFLRKRHHAQSHDAEGASE
jgi:hypothetical protein